MKFFVDTANIEDIRELADGGLLDGVTTNPSLVARSGKKFTDLVAEICAVVQGSVSAEVASTEFGPMLAEGKKLAGIAPNVTVKVPLTPAGLRVCRELRGQGATVNVTLCFSAGQAILAAKAGATYISPFVGRLDDIAQDGMSLIRDIIQIYRQYPAFQTQVLVASVRHPMHIVEAAKIGADVVTCPPDTLKKLYDHPLTAKGLDAFVKDWARTGQSIL